MDVPWRDIQGTGWPARAVGLGPEGWLARLCTCVLEASPDLASHSRLVWRARTGANALLTEKRSPVGTAPKLIQEFAMTLEQVLRESVQDD